MGSDEAALAPLWEREAGEVEPQDLSGNLVVQLGVATEGLNRRWYEANTGWRICDVQRRVRHPTVRWLGATLDGRIEGSGAVFDSKIHAAVVVLGRGRAREIRPAAAAQYVGGGGPPGGAVGHHGGGKWVEIIANADPLYQHLIVTAERKFWRCVESEPVLSTMLLAEANDPLVISDQRTGELDRRRDQKPVRRVAVLEVMELIAAGCSFVMLQRVRRGRCVRCQQEAQSPKQ
jgi:hypothetical protein